MHSVPLAGHPLVRAGRLLMAAGALAGILPARAQAQAPALRGVVLGQENGAPVPLALVTLPELRRQLFTSADGTFVLPDLPSGRHRMRVEQVGRATMDTVVAVPAPSGGDGRGYVLRLAPQSLALEGVQVSAAAGECRTRGFSDPAEAVALTALLDEVRKNAERYRVLLDEHPLELRSQRTRTYLREDRSERATRTDTLTVSSRDMTGEYRPGGVLRNEAAPGERPNWKMRMPSAYSIAQADFQNAHCFRYAGIETVDGTPMHRIGFVPTREVGGPDVAGALFIDTERRLLRRAEFQVVNLPEQGINFEAVTAVVTYREVQPSLVIPAVVSSSQRLNGVRFQNDPVRFYTESQSVLSSRFLGAVPGVRPSPGASGGDAQR